MCRTIASYQKYKICSHFFEVVEPSLCCTKSNAGPVDYLFRIPFVVKVLWAENEGTRCLSRMVWLILGEQKAVYRKWHRTDLEWVANNGISATALPGGDI